MLKKVVLAEAVFLSFLLSCLFCYLIAEKYFFAIFFEKKSRIHGYWEEGKVLYETDFGERGKDSVYLKNLANKTVSEEDDLDQSFKIAIFGDSYAWGDGNRINKTFPKVLEKELANTLTGSNKIYNFSLGGDSLLDHVAKIDILKRNEKKMNLYIILLVENDLVLRPTDNFYKSTVYKSIIDYCKLLNPGVEVTRHPDWNLPIEEKNRLVIESHYASFENKVNQCIFKEGLEKIKTMTDNKAIFIISDYHKEKNKQWSSIIDYLSEKNINYIDSYNGFNLKKYTHCWASEESLEKCFWVTPKDGHPSALMHNLYADLIKNIVLDSYLQ